MPPSQNLVMSFSVHLKWILQWVLVSLTGRFMFLTLFLLAGEAAVRRQAALPGAHGHEHRAQDDGRVDGWRNRTDDVIERMTSHNDPPATKLNLFSCTFIIIQVFVHLQALESSNKNILIPCLFLNDFPGSTVGGQTYCISCDECCWRPTRYTLTYVLQ